MRKFKSGARLMGSDFELIVIGKDEQEARKALDGGIAEIKRLEHLLTEFSDQSETHKINTAAGVEAIPVSPEVYTLIERCQQISALTQGAFDISTGLLKSLYNFKSKDAVLPHRLKIADALHRVGYQNIEMNGGKVFLKKKGMRIGFGAIGKGYAADCVKKIWQNAGIASGVINASGDLTAWGVQEDNTPWKVGIANPDNPAEILFWIPAHDASVATSGNYEQYIDLNGTRYSHNIDPRSGKPAKYIKSVTIVSPSAELSDALATAVTIMGIDVGLNFINQLPTVHGVIIDEDSKVFTSRHIKTYTS